MSIQNVTISSTGFIPCNLSISVGDTVIWTNGDTNLHTVSFIPPVPVGSIISGEIASGSTYQNTFTQSGTFVYQDTETGYKGTITSS